MRTTASTLLRPLAVAIACALNMGAGRIFAVNVDTRAQRPVPNAISTIINCDETFTFTLLRGDAAIDPSGKTQPPATRPYVPQLQRMFPGKKLEDLTPDLLRFAAALVTLMAAIALGLVR